MSVNRYVAEGSGMTFCAECAEVETEDGDTCTPSPRSDEETEFGDFYFQCEGCDHTHLIDGEDYPETTCYFTAMD